MNRKPLRGCYEKRTRLLPNRNGSLNHVTQVYINDTCPCRIPMGFAHKQFNEITESLELDLSVINALIEHEVHLDEL